MPVAGVWHRLCNFMIRHVRAALTPPGNANTAGRRSITRAGRHILFGAVVVLFLLAAAGSHAARITAVDIKPGPEATYLVLQGDAPFRFQLDLAGPRDIEISLPGSTLDADLPEKGQKGLIGTITGSRSNSTLILRLRTTQPGVTILPMYDAATRRLSVELGGQPGRAVEVPQPKATAERAGTAPAVAAEKVPLDRAAEPVTPPAQQTPQAAKTEEKPRQNELMPAQEKPVPNIKAIRLAASRPIPGWWSRATPRWRPSTSRKAGSAGCVCGGGGLCPAPRLTMRTTGCRPSG